MLPEIDDEVTCGHYFEQLAIELNAEFVSKPFEITVHDLCEVQMYQ
jgi:hypothetical protein